MHSNYQSNEQRLTDILERLERGESREEIAAAMGYKSYRSLHTYMTRKGYKWDDRKKTYLPASRKKNKRSKAPSEPEDRAAKIIALFEQGIDARAVAREMNFTKYLDMAAYMSERGFRWDTEKENYVIGRPEQKKPAKKADAVAVRMKENSTIDKPGSSILELLQSCLSNLDWLMNNREKLNNMINTVEKPLEICTYSLEGKKVAKEVCVNDCLVELLLRITGETGLSPEKLVESALVEYLQAHGYGNEVELLLH